MSHHHRQMLAGRHSAAENKQLRHDAHAVCRARHTRAGWPGEWEGGAEGHVSASPTRPTAYAPAPDFGGNIEVDGCVNKIASRGEGRGARPRATDEQVVAMDKEFAPCRVEVRAGRPGGGVRRRMRHARGGPDSRLGGQGTRADGARIKHGRVGPFTSPPTRAPYEPGEAMTCEPSVVYGLGVTRRRPCKACSAHTSPISPCFHHGS